MITTNKSHIEWPTLAALAAAYLTWGIGTTILASVSIPLAIMVTAVAIALHSSVTHEVTHGHPFKNQVLNAALVFPALALIFPYLRFRDTHLAHHSDCQLTDPYDDPESNYLDPSAWDTLDPFCRTLMTLNNTLAGRLILGPFLGAVTFIAADIRNMRSNPRILWGWLLHIPSVAIVLIWIANSAMPLWAYLIACYASHSLIRIRTFLEHQAHERARGRSVIIEDNGPLAFLFLNNNYHAIHHSHPSVPWYRLRGLYAKNRARYLRQNDGYVFRSYAEVFRKYLFRRKDPVAHPLWRRG